jgi:hypothetical protein
LTGNWEEASGAKPLRPFCDEALDFLNALSRKLTVVRAHSDVATFGFWCRKAALLREKARYDDLPLRLGKGLVFHSAPSNVPVTFAFSFAAGLLAGNANIVRLPGRDFAQTDRIVEAVNELLRNGYGALSPYVCFVKYPSDRALSDRFSALCDARVLWGGDGTIEGLRRSPLKPRATDITFADRYSAALIHADAYLAAPDRDRIALDFYNDTYFSDQNACTAPRIVFWLGREKEAAKTSFWRAVHRLAEEKYALAPVQAVDKLAALYRAAARFPVSLAPSPDNLLTRVQAAAAPAALMDFRRHSGFFFEHDIETLADILPVCGERMQTVTYYGLGKEELLSFFAAHTPKGVDRFVPFGASMDFSLVWDGHDLIRALSRKFTVL